MSKQSSKVYSDSNGNDSIEGKGGDCGGADLENAGVSELLHQEMLSRLRRDLLGEEPVGSQLKSAFYRIDPFQGEQMVRAPKNFKNANIYCGLIYFSIIILFAASALYQFYTR